MSYFTEEQIKWLQDAGFEWNQRFECFYLRDRKTYTTIFVETCDEEFLVGISRALRYTIKALDADLKKAIRQACREHKQRLQEMQQVDAILDALFAKPAKLKFNKKEQ